MANKPKKKKDLLKPADLCGCQQDHMTEKEKIEYCNLINAGKESEAFDFWTERINIKLFKLRTK